MNHPFDDRHKDPFSIRCRHSMPGCKPYVNQLPNGMPVTVQISIQRNNLNMGSFEAVQISVAFVGINHLSSTMWCLILSYWDITASYRASVKSAAFTKWQFQEDISNHKLLNWYLRLHITNHGHTPSINKLMLTAPLKAKLWMTSRWLYVPRTPRYNLIPSSESPCLQNSVAFY